MGKITFSWDDRKAAQNLGKHGVSFEDASTVFFDENAKEFFDPTIRLMKTGSLCWGLTADCDCWLFHIVLTAREGKSGLFPQGRRQRRKKANLPEVNYEKRIRFFET